MSDISPRSVKKILFTGAESTGKTTCSGWLGTVTGWMVVPEAARSYLSLHGPDYTEQEVLTMAELQWEDENRARATRDTIICDTDLLTYIIWLREKYNARQDIIWQRYLAMLPDICFLCMPDIPWEPDPLREHPNDRDRLTQMYIRVLAETGIQPVCLFGSLSERQQAILEVLRW